MALAPLASKPAKEAGTREYGSVRICAAAHYRRIVENHASLSSPWVGWRLAGRDLVVPDCQRISPERLRGLMFRDASEKRLSVNRLQAASRSSRVVSLPARERFEGMT